MTEKEDYWYYNTDWEKYSDESLDFMISESEKLLSETFTSYREMTNKSYALFGYYMAVLAYCCKVIFEQASTPLLTPFLITIIGIVFSVWILWNNLTPRNLSYLGSKPIKMTHKDFETEDQKEQLRLYKISKIGANNEAITDNDNENDRRSVKFKVSIRVFLVSIIISITIHLLCLHYHGSQNAPLLFCE